MASSEVGEVVALLQAATAAVRRAVAGLLACACDCSDEVACERCRALADAAALMEEHS